MSQCPPQSQGQGVLGGCGLGGACNCKAFGPAQFPQINTEGIIGPISLKYEHCVYITYSSIVPLAIYISYIFI